MASQQKKFASRSSSFILVSLAACWVPSLVFTPAGTPGGLGPASQGVSLTRRGVLGDKASATWSVEGQGIAKRVESLREASLDACLHATEDDAAAAEECAVLSYDLAVAEQVMARKKDKDHFEWTDSDSY
eukprot:TRINITY_DN64841_c0_g1_i1.p1 TRINITY_DN64841_c0_g1~~TRINITY_DN64841_c0_g1_i1.p1  ORF type:complete len:149 (-),score=28.45 TRINITY_DN64841_c0_g1_i1:118-507(-)